MAKKETTPMWMLAVIIVAMLPVFQFPVLLANDPAGTQSVRTLLWIYPFYVLMSGYLAYQSYPQRRDISWILVILMLMTHVAAYYLVVYANNPY